MSNCRRFEYSSQEKRSQIATRIFAKILKSAFKQYRKLWDDYLELIREYENVEGNQRDRNTDKAPLNDSTPMHTIFSLDEGESNVFKEASDAFIPDSQYDSTKDFELDGITCIESPQRSPVFINKRRKYSKRLSLSRSDVSRNINVSLVDTSLLNDEEPAVKQQKVSLESSIADASKDDLYLSVINSSVVNDGQVKVSNNISEEKTKSRLVDTSNGPNNSVQNNTDEHASIKPTVSLGISNLYNVGTKISLNGKKLKQTRLIFQPNEEVSIIGKSDSSSLSKSSELTKQNDEKLAKIEETPSKCNKTFNDDIIENSPYQSIPFANNKIRHKLKRMKHKDDELMIDKGCENFKPPEDKSSCTSAHLQVPPWCSTQVEDDSDLMPRSRTTCNITPIKSITNNPTNSIISSPLLVHDDDFHDNLVNNSSTVCQGSIGIEKLQEKKDMNNTKQILEKSEACESPTCNAETFFAPAEELKENDMNAPQHMSLSTRKVSKKSKETSTSTRRTLLSSFNKVPWRNEDIDDKTRNKAERQRMNGWSCWQCKKYYEGLGLSEEQLQIRKNQCSRHRSKYDAKPCTPASFWDPALPDTLPSLREDE